MTQYTQISLDEREKIFQLLKAGISLTKISAHLGRHKSSISREISRNKSHKLGYLPDKANNLSLGRKNRQISKIEKYPDLKKYVIDRLSLDKWSPEAIAGRMTLEKHQVLISHETIYQYIYSFPGQKQKLYQHLMLAKAVKIFKKKKSDPR